MARPTRRARRVFNPNSSWKQILYIGARAGTFTVPGVHTRRNYTICPKVLIPIHPGDMKFFEKHPREYRTVW